MISKLPRWLEIGGFCLTALAGCVNAVGLLGFRHQAVSHLTGTTTLVGLSIVTGDLTNTFHLALVLGAFVLGAALSGALVERSALKLSSPYSGALLGEAGLLVMAMLALEAGSTTGHLFASTACGLQNGLVSTFSGATVRTTHVSGLFTDLGTMLGARIRGHEFDRRRVLLYLTLIAGFVTGSAVGAFLFPLWRFKTLAFVAGGAALLSAASYFLRERS
jgi:uncharacterized membrane protein YoaK (UPF0700 family)